MEDHLDPRRAHARVALIDGRGAPAPPHVRFYTTPGLRGAAALELTPRGFLAGGRAICVWSADAFKPGAPYPSSVLVSPGSRGAACPPDVPVKSFPEAPTWAFIELTRLDGFLGTLTYRGISYFFDVRPIVGSRWQRASLVHWPKSSPPLAGGVDIPRIFHPANRKEPYSIALHAAPNAAAAVVTRVTSTHYFEKFSIGQGALLAAVYGRAGRWSLLRLIDGRTAWIAPQDSARFVSVESLALRADGMRGWDWTLAPEPGSAQRTAVPHDPRRKWIGYLVEREPLNGSVPIFSTPDRNATQLAVWGSTTHIVLASVRPDQSRPIIFSRQAGWLEVGLEAFRETYSQESAKHGWIEDSPSRWTVRLVEPDAAENLLKRAWAPESGPSATVIETRTVEGKLWLHVKVVAGEPCEHAMYPDLAWPPATEGWTPAHDRFGKLVVWFETYCD